MEPSGHRGWFSVEGGCRAAYLHHQHHRTPGIPVRLEPPGVAQWESAGFLLEHVGLAPSSPEQIAAPPPGPCGTGTRGAGEPPDGAREYKGSLSTPEHRGPQLSPPVTPFFPLKPEHELKISYHDERRSLTSPGSSGAAGSTQRSLPPSTKKAPSGFTPFHRGAECLILRWRMTKGVVR